MLKNEHTILDRRQSQLNLSQIGIFGALRRNFALKIISLCLAIVLYAYVLQEKNPVVTHSFLADVIYRNNKPGMIIVNETPRVEVSVSGSKASIDRMKDGDIKAVVDFNTFQIKDAPFKVGYVYEKPQIFNDVNLDSPREFIKLQVFRQKRRKLEVTPIYKKDAPGGLKYGEPNVKPSQVEIRGRGDLVDSVDRIVAVATPSEKMGSIDGDFTLSARDGEDHPVENITIDPEEVHVTVRQSDALVMQTVFVQVVVADNPQAGYSHGNLTSNPIQVRVVGTFNQVKNIKGVFTEDVITRNLTEDTVQEVNLILPPDVKVQDSNGRDISKVRVTIPISRNKPQLPTTNGIQP